MALLVRTLTFKYSSGLAVAFEASSRNPLVVKEPHGFTPRTLGVVPGDRVVAASTLPTRKLRHRGVHQLAKITLGQGARARFQPGPAQHLGSSPSVTSSGKPSLTSLVDAGPPMPP